MEVKHRIQIIDLIENKQTAIVAELGCAEGNFSLDLLNSGICKLIMVDNWGKIEGITGDGNFEQEWHDNNYRSAMLKVEPFKEKVQVLRGLTSQMSLYVEDNSIDILYLDAGHSYQAVMADLCAWFDKVKDGGIIAGHDYINPAYGVREAVEDFVYGSWDINIIYEDRDEDAGFWFRKISN